MALLSSVYALLSLVYALLSLGYTVHWWYRIVSGALRYDEQRSARRASPYFANVGFHNFGAVPRLRLVSGPLKFS